MRPRTRFAQRAGFTLIEVIIVIVMIGILTAVAVPFLRGGSTKSDVNASLSAVASLHAVARSSAIQRGRTAVLVVNAATGTALVVLKRTGSTAVDTVGRVHDLAARYRVSVSTTSDSTFFTPRGIGAGASNNTVIATRGSYTDTLVISAAGRLLR